MINKIYKIAITGPESTGKTSLSEQLASHYNTDWVPEYARMYLDTLGVPYKQGDLLEIAQGQAHAEDRALQRANKLLFSDTELTNLKIWSEFKYKTCHPWILQEIQKRHYDLYLLMYIDTPWEYDAQREHPESRRFFFDWFQRELQAQGASVKVIHGLGEQRVQNAIEAVDVFLGDSPSF